MPVCTWRKTGLPSCMTRTNEVLALPETAVVGTMSTLLACWRTMSSVPVIPDLANFGRLCGETVIEYCVELDELVAEELLDAGSLEMKLMRPVKASLVVAVDRHLGLLTDLETGDV